MLDRNYHGLLLGLIVKNHRQPQYCNYSTDTEYSIEYVNGVAYIAFAGSEHWRDWLINLWVFGNSQGKVKVHAGFAYAYKCLKEHLYEKLFELPTIEKLCVGGYSQGGAIAQICARDLQRLGFNVRCLSLGSPPVGNMEYDRTCEFEHHRIYNHFDPVPRSLANWLVGFNHYQTTSDELRFLSPNPHDLGGYIKAKNQSLNKSKVKSQKSKAKSK